VRCSPSPRRLKSLTLENPPRSGFELTTYNIGKFQSAAMNGVASTGGRLSRLPVMVPLNCQEIGFMPKAASVASPLMCEPAARDDGSPPPALPACSLSQVVWPSPAHDMLFVFQHLSSPWRLFGEDVAVRVAHSTAQPALRAGRVSLARYGYLSRRRSERPA
jgi:hypothetical protein